MTLGSELYNFSNNHLNEKISQLIINSIEDHAIFVLDPNGFIMTWNPGAENITGFTAGEALGKHFSVFYTDEDKHHNVANTDLTLALRNNKYETEGWRVKKDGTRFWADNTITTLYSENGRLLGFTKVTCDATYRKLSDDHKSRMSAELERRIVSKDKAAISEQRRFRKLIENSYDGISLFDKDLQVFYRSRSAERIVGWNNMERTEREIEDLIHPEDIDIVNQTFADVFAHPDRPVISQYRTKHKQGHYIWVESLISNKLQDADINAIVCNFRDVTERVQAEARIRERNHRIDEILESMTDGFISLDKDFRYTYVNRQIGEMIGYDQRTLIGKNIWNVFPEAVGSATFDAFRQAMLTQRYTWNEDYYAPLQLWQENHIYPSKHGLSIFIRDITERKLAEASMLRSESNLRSIFENTDLAMILFDAGANVVSFNNNAAILSERHFHKTLKAGMPAMHYASITRRQSVENIFDEIRTRSPIVYEVSYPLPDNVTAWFEVRWVNVTNEENASIGVLLSLKNITDKKLAELERERVTKDLIQRNKDLEQFTYIVSHNLRAPVANIKGLTNLLDGLPCNEETDETLKLLSTSITQLDTIIMDLNNILQVSSEANDTLEKVSLISLVEKIESATSLLIKKNNAIITYDFNELPTLMSIKSYLYSIFQNLVVNSIKFRKADVDPVISITSKTDGTKAIIFFEDNGKGIDLQKQQAHLFGLYKRFDMSVGGKGMGLFMVKMQTERLGGKIHIESEPDKGTTFKLEFPLK
ncbi:PAS domain-containing sensor histidine kinase [Mucilaginibacter myungsuensis]|uniref:histidine kinase n=1 Tax=Mucilaginibacter myungsuensis TaxID=649104 RepID=A0A929KXX1_9SPHI|nr:PAS domain-containing sensor histidine kinase [Mucilaginibacter myungsuensis]MBE9660645.1 PAS domain-containing sensor histidine kinase [Mucilaginibacter myungsuensis]MDN3600690.1 PAS domain-containing sensor histidine kinase [Mucilaginibacter myungsuensis]